MGFNPRQPKHKWFQTASFYPQLACSSLKWTIPAPCPCPKYEAISHVEKEQSYLKNSSTYSRRPLPFDKVLQRPLLFRGFKTFTARQILFAGRTSCNPYAHCTVGPEGGQSGGSGPELMTAGGWRNIGWVRPAENPAQRFRGRYSLCGWPGRRLCSSSSSPDTSCRS